MGSETWAARSGSGVVKEMRRIGRSASVCTSPTLTLFWPTMPGARLAPGDGAQEYVDRRDDGARVYGRGTSPYSLLHDPDLLIGEAVELVDDLVDGPVCLLDSRQEGRGVAIESSNSWRRSSWNLRLAGSALSFRLFFSYTHPIRLFGVLSLIRGYSSS